MEHIWTMLMHKILQNHLLRAFVANLKNDAIYALYPESFCDKNLANQKFFAFCDSATQVSGHGGMVWPPIWQDGHYTSLNKITGYKIYSDPKVKLCSEWLKNCFLSRN